MIQPLENWTKKFWKSQMFGFQVLCTRMVTVFDSKMGLINHYHLKNRTPIKIFEGFCYLRVQTFLKWQWNGLAR